jgi:hypothetical protein
VKNTGNLDRVGHDLIDHDIGQRANVSSRRPAMRRLARPSFGKILQAGSKMSFFWSSGTGKRSRRTKERGEAPSEIARTIALRPDFPVAQSCVFRKPTPPGVLVLRAQLLECDLATDPVYIGFFRFRRLLMVRNLSGALLVKHKGLRTGMLIRIRSIKTCPTGLQHS